jgi:hypothetical protein
LAAVGGIGAVVALVSAVISIKGLEQTDAATIMSERMADPPNIGTA